MNNELKKYLLDIAELIDAYRVIPRAILLAYGLVCYDFYTFILATDNPAPYQWFGAALFGVSSFVSGLYFKSGKDWVEYNKLKKQIKDMENSK